MKNIIFSMLLLKEVVTATIYHAVPDLEKLGYTFGVKVCIEGTGIFDGDWTVQDRMNARWVKRIDFLVNEDVKGGKWNNIKIEINEHQ